MQRAVGRLKAHVMTQLERSGIAFTLFVVSASHMMSLPSCDALTIQVGLDFVREGCEIYSPLHGVYFAKVALEDPPCCERLLQGWDARASVH